MRKILQIAINDLRVIVADRSFLINLVLIPIGLSLAVGYANGAGSSGNAAPSRALVDMIDLDQSALSGQLAARLRDLAPDVRLCPLDNTPDDACQLAGASLDSAQAEARLKANTTEAVIEIPAGFGATLAAGKTASAVYRSDEDASSPSALLQSVQAAAQQVGGAVSAGRIGADILADFADESQLALQQDVSSRAETLWAQNPIAVNFVQGASPANTQQSGSGFNQSIPGIASMYVMFAVLPAMAAFIDERRNWTLQRLVTMPLRRSQVLGGKLLARFALGMVQYAIIFGFGLLIGVRFGGSALAIVLVMAAFTLCLTALALALVTLLRTGGQARGLTLFLTLTLAPLGGAWWPLEIVPGWMRTAGHISPLAWAMDGFNAITVRGDLNAAAVAVLVLVGAAAALFAFGVRRFQYE